MAGKIIRIVNTLRKEDSFFFRGMIQFSWYIYIFAHVCPLIPRETARSKINGRVCQTRYPVAQRASDCNWGFKRCLCQVRMKHTRCRSFLLLAQLVGRRPCAPFRLNAPCVCYNCIQFCGRNNAPIIRISVLRPSSERSGIFDYSLLFSPRTKDGFDHISARLKEKQGKIVSSMRIIL